MHSKLKVCYFPSIFRKQKVVRCHLKFIFQSSVSQPLGRYPLQAVNVDFFKKYKLIYKSIPNWHLNLHMSEPYHIFQHSGEER